MTVEKEPWFLKVAEELDTFCIRVDDKILKEQHWLGACKNKNELETNLAHEMKLNKELNERLTELLRRGIELDQTCASFKSCLTFADSDQNRLDSAKETYEIGKELTGIRLDFRAPPNIAKGYIKNKHRNQLQAFEIDMTCSDSTALWALLDGSSANNENRPIN